MDSVQDSPSLDRCPLPSCAPFSADSSLPPLDYESLFPKVPIDSDGFVISFSPSDTEGILNFFEEFGFVVINEVLNKMEVDRTIDEVWKILADHAKQVSLFHNGSESDSEIIRDRFREDPSLWSSYWQKHAEKAGIIGPEPSSGYQIMQNRQNPTIYSIFKELYRRFTDIDRVPESLRGFPLLVSFDRVGLMRPTRQVLMNGIDVLESEAEPILEDHPEWITKNTWFHVDMNPWLWCGLVQLAPNDESISVRRYTMNYLPAEGNSSSLSCYPKLQSLLVLTDSTESSGGFTAVPGFHKVLCEWARRTDFPAVSRDLTFASFLQTDPVCSYAQKITARAGSMIVWRSELPHCNYPNESDSFRIVQYLKMIPRDSVDDLRHDEARASRRETVESFFVEGFEVNDIGKEVFDLF